MAALPYCILLSKSLVDVPPKGICDDGIQRLTQGSLVALYSQIERTDISAPNFQQAALEFHEVVHAVFRYAAVVPFRFPTWLSETELAVHLREQWARYEDFLTQHAQHVQMEIRIELPTSEASQPASSGTEHLRKLATQSRELHSEKEKLKELFSAEVIEWRERELPRGLRMYALVERNRVASFRERLSGRDPTLSHSGPWPAMEFFNSQDHHGNTETRRKNE
jgi:Gas vesicle synthesis protein GvpL/GvpF